MKVALIGGGGLIGSKLAERIIAENGEAVIIGRSAQPANRPPGSDYYRADATEPGSLEAPLADADAVVNLAGVSIFGRWSKKRKEAIYDSRVLSTRNTVASLGAKTKTLINISAVGYYGFETDAPRTESSPAGNDFLAGVCRDWEAEARKAKAAGVRTAIARIAVVLDANGGALAQMLPIFKLGLGGPLGSGRQPFSWIHHHDVVEALYFLLTSSDASGPYNLASPNPTTNREFAHALGAALNRPAFLPTPPFALKAVMGEFGSFLLEGQNAIPQKLNDAGFEFSRPDLSSALDNLLK